MEQLRQSRLRGLHLRPAVADHHHAAHGIDRNPLQLENLLDGTGHLLRFWRRDCRRDRECDGNIALLLAALLVGIAHDHREFFRERVHKGIRHEVDDIERLVEACIFELHLTVARIIVIAVEDQVDSKVAEYALVNGLGIAAQVERNFARPGFERRWRQQSRDIAHVAVRDTHQRVVGIYFDRRIFSGGETGLFERLRPELRRLARGEQVLGVEIRRLRIEKPGFRDFALFF